MSYNWLSDTITALSRNKSLSIQSYVEYTLCKTARMFNYSNLPLTIHGRHIETCLQSGQTVAVFMHNDNLVALPCTTGGPRNARKEPTIAYVSSPELMITGLELTIDIDCVVFRNDTFGIGLLPLIYEYASLHTEQKISMRNAIIDMREPFITEAKDESTAESVKLFMNAVEQGKRYVVVSDSVPFTGDSNLKTHQRLLPTNNSVTSLIEASQYNKSSFYAELGININENMKREYVNEGEMDVGNTASRLLIEDMFECRCETVSKLNALFDLDVEVEFGDLWKQEDKHDEQKSDEIPTGDGIVEDGESKQELKVEKETENEEITDNEQEADSEEINSEEIDNEDTDSDGIEDIDKEELIESTEFINGEMEVEENEETDENGDNDETDEREVDETTDTERSSETEDDDDDKLGESKDEVEEDEEED